MTGPRSARRRIRLASISALLALAVTMLTPVGAAAAEAPSAVDATLLQVGQTEQGPLTIGAADSTGTPVASPLAFRVPSTDAFPAAVDATGVTVAGGTVLMEWTAVSLPGAAAPGPTEGGGAQVIVTSADSTALLGSASDAPKSLELAPGERLEASWRFTAPGDYTVTSTATLLDEAGVRVHTSQPHILTFHVDAPQTVPAPAPEPVPAPEPGVDPGPHPLPETPGSSRPDNQSDQPAPSSREKTIVENVHTDTVSAYLDGDKLILDTKADMDVTGDGIVDLGTRLATSDVLFHLSDKARTQVPNLPAYAFLGVPGDTIWLAPQTQNHEIIWPGFSTEDPRLDGQVQGDRLDVRLLDARGPGELEVYLQNGPTVNRVFSSTASLPAWSTGVPQHTHMNWAFTRPGTYTLTFEMSGTVSGRAQSAQNDYTFVVGDIDDHTRTTATTLTASFGAVSPDESVLLTAEVAPTDAAGAVQFRDTTSNRVLGHTPLVDGKATFLATALTPGTHRVVAEFVPTWRTDHSPSSSPPVEVRVDGEALPKPGFDDRTPPADADYRAHPAGVGLAITTPGKTLSGGTVSARATSAIAAGRWLSVWMPGQNPEWRGWVQADLLGGLTVDLPAGIRPGAHRLAVKLDDGSFLGWDELTVTGSTGGGQAPAPPPPPVPIGPAPTAPSQQCVPGVVLETGHIDAFFVSAANGKAVLQLMEDVTGHRVVREAESVLLRVKESAFRSDIPGGIPGAPAGYVLPLTQNSDLIWPGWDTNRTAASGHTDVSIHVSSVDGPGRVHLSSQGSFGGIESLLAGGGYSLPGVIRVPEPAHTHAQWVFSEKGIYKLTVHAVATNPATGASLHTAPHTYVFQVGDVPLGDAFCGLRSADSDAAKEVNAAVNAAAAQAVAAAQAAAVTGSTTKLLEGRDRDIAGAAAADETTAGLAIAEQERPFIAGVIGGGVLIVAGIIGASAWYLRRLRAVPALVAARAVDR